MHSIALAIVLAAAAPPPADLPAGGGFAARGLAGCNSDLRYLNQLSGWQVRWPQDWEELATASDDEIGRAIALWKHAPEALLRDREALQSGNMARAPKAIVERVLPQVEALARNLGKSTPALRSGAPPVLRAAWDRLFRNEIIPAIERYATYLRNGYLPHASRSPGLVAIPGGAKCFRDAVRFFSTLDLPLQELEQTGWTLLRDTEAELAELFNVDRGRLPERLERLRAHKTPGFDRDALLAVSRAAAQRGFEAAPRMFGRPARTSVTFAPVGASMEQSFTAAAYLGSHGNGAPVALLNLSRPQERQLTAEAIAFHETLPGHHAAEALDYPFGTAPSSGYLEGWGMYAERLADEMHLYSSQLDRAGMLARRMAAAARPVIEAGLHARGWTRARAIAFLREHSILSRAEIEIEVDRMIAGPGQPLSYMIGYAQLVEARAFAEKALGSAFDLREFHSQVLSKGARPLPELRADIGTWVASKARGARPVN